MDATSSRWQLGLINNINNQFSSGWYDQDGFVSMFSPNGALLWSTPLSLAYEDWGFQITVDNLDNVYISGNYNSSNGGVVIKFTPGGERVVWYGAYPDYLLSGVVADNVGNAFVTGRHYIHPNGYLLKFSYVPPPAYDLTCTSPTDCQSDRFLIRKGNKVEVTDDLAVLMEANVKRSGVVADGVTRLLLREPSAEPVTFSLQQEDGSPADETQPCMWGRLQTRDGSMSSCHSIRVTPEEVPGVGLVAFAVYQAPEWSWPRFEAKTFSINTLVGAGDSANLALSLHPPQTLIVHGLWGSSKSWQQLGDFLKHDKGLDMCPGCLVDYSNVERAAGSFDPYNDKDQRTLNVLHEAIKQALLYDHQRDIAATQVNLVGHSMGGLVSRAWIRRETHRNAYRTLANSDQGMVHKLITLATPHYGSPFGDLLMENRCLLESLNAKYDGRHGRTCDVQNTLEQKVNKLEMFMGEAVRDLQTGSKAIRDIGETDVSAHLIAGIAPDMSSNEMALGVLLNWYPQVQYTEASLNAVGPCPVEEGEDPSLVDKILGYSLSAAPSGYYTLHDTVVGFDSQRALSWDYNTPAEVFCGVQHSPLKVQLFGIEIPLTKESQQDSERVRERVAELLSIPKSDPTFPGVFGAIGPLPEGGKNLPYPIEPCPTPSLDQNGCPVVANNLVKGPSGQTAVVQSATSTQGASINLSPADGSSIQPGTTVSFVFSIQGGYPTNGAILVLSDGYRSVERVTMEGAGPYQFNLPIPAEWAGEFKVYAQTLGGTIENYSIDSTVVVTPASPPTALLVTPYNVVLKYLGQELPLKVQGFAWPQISDLTAGSSGTLYSIVSGTEGVIRVDVNGVITALGAGMDRVRVTYGALTFDVPVVVRILNQAPEFSLPDTLELGVGESRTLSLSARDAEGDAIFWLLNGPSFLSLNDFGDGRGQLHLTPGAGDAGHFSIKVIARDSGEPMGQTSRTMAVTVLGSNVTPMALDPVSVANVTAISATLSATSNLVGTGYWLVVLQGSTAPTAAEVKAGVDYAGVSVVAHGSGSLPNGVATDFGISGWLLLGSEVMVQFCFCPPCAASTS